MGTLVDGGPTIEAEKVLSSLRLKIAFAICAARRQMFALAIARTSSGRLGLDAATVMTLLCNFFATRPPMFGPAVLMSKKSKKSKKSITYQALA